MTMKNQQKHDLTPFPTILASMDGDTTAIAAILKRYEGYIATLSTRELFDGQGNPVEYVDEDIRRRLEIRLTLGLPSPHFQIKLE